MNKANGAPERTRAGFGLMRLGRWAGPVTFLAVLALPESEGLSTEALRTAAALLWIIIWWGTEAVPIAITSLLPLVLLPMLGIDSMAVVAVFPVRGCETYLS